MEFRHLIVVASYQAPNLIKKCLDFLVRTTDLKKNKIAVIDDGSRQPVIKILKKFERKYPAITFFFNKKNIGKPKSVNIVLKKFPNADYYTLLDQDVFISTKNWDRILFKAHRVFADNSILGAFTYEKGFPFVKNGFHFLDPYPFWTLAGRFFSFSKKVFKKLGYFYDQSFRHEDREYCFRAFLAGYKWYYLKDIKARTVTHRSTARRRFELNRGRSEEKSIQRQRNDYLMRTHRLYYTG